ncbi:serine hydrolase domain-containing protein [Microbacterium radiodurans]|uniref:Beta-lactamase family protein n=1 Tax=Microbacterium radiodurans TaxID=661398 RepID=A0A5J5IV25_9MICO|nr:serine hydrolase domain-containing protein [Microbacterium radiodurans]KAA9089146.1 beta-lactamase family protein [Microbacterium radiodurans]
MSRAGFVRRGLGIVGAVALALTVTACAPAGIGDVEAPPQADAALGDDTQAQLTAAVERAMASTGSGGAIVGVWVPWAGEWVQAFGSNPDGTAVSADDTFKAGPVTRAMTCDVLFGLAADGVVEVDDPVTDWVNGFPDAPVVTLGDLCDGTSGVGRYQPPLQARWETNPTRPWTPHELVAYGLAAGAPSADRVYGESDTGYVLLGLALERASGRTAADLFDTYVFSPLEMTASSLPGRSVDLGLHGTQSVLTAEGAVDCATATDLTALSTSAGFTSSGVVTDAADLGRYARALATGLRPYDDESRFASPLPVAEGVPNWYTVRGGTYQAGTLVGQYGSVPGYQTVAFADRDSGLTVVAVLNNSRASAEAVRVLGWQLAAIASKAPATAGETAPPAGLPWTPEQMDGDLASVAICPLP